MDELVYEAIWVLLSNLIGFNGAHKIQQQHRVLFMRNNILHKLTIHDPLTGIFNRRYFNEMLDKEWRRAVRDQTPLSLLLLDIDYFKALSGGLGETYADDCLMLVAEALSASIARPADIVARYGGEEFICLLPETDKAGARTVANRIQTRLAQNERPHPASPLGPFLTLSIGVATTFPPSQSARNLIQLADGALKVARSRGRNRIEVADFGDRPAVGGRMAKS